MKKTSKKPRKFGRRKVKTKPAKKLERQIRRMLGEAIVLMDELQQGFREWYMKNYDESGSFVAEKIIE